MKITYNGKSYNNINSALKDGINEIVIHNAKSIIEPYLSLINKHNGTVEIIIDKDHNAKIKIDGLPKLIEDKLKLQLPFD